MKKSRVIIAGLLALMVISSLCIGSQSHAPSSTPIHSSQLTKSTSTSSYSTTTTASESSPSANDSGCSECQVGPSENQSGSGEVSPSNSTPPNGTGETNTSVEQNTSTNSTSSSEAVGNSAGNTTQENETASTSGGTNTTLSELPHPFPEYRLPLNDSLVKFYIYGSTNCCKCKRLIAFLNETYGPDSIVRVYDFNSGENGSLLLDSLIGDYSDMLLLPVTGVFYNGTLVAVISGYTLPYDVEGPIKLALKNRLVVLVGYDGSLHYVGSEKKRAELEMLFLYNRLPSGA